MKKELVGQRGKDAEKIVGDILKRWNNRASFAFWRLPDSRSARSFVTAQPGDYAYFCGDYGGIIEVKSSLAPSRIAKDKISQLPTLHKLELAGARCIILIHHSVADVWRAVKPSQLEMGPPSWDLSEVPTYATAEAALQATGYFNGL